MSRRITLVALVGLVGACQQLSSGSATRGQQSGNGATSTRAAPTLLEPSKDEARVKGGAESTSEPSTSPCELSYEQTKAVIAANPSMLSVPNAPSEPTARIELAPREVYLRDCERLPKLVQHCLVFAYAAAHGDECTKARAEYDGARSKEMATNEGR